MIHPCHTPRDSNAIARGERERGRCFDIDHGRGGVDRDRERTRATMSTTTPGAHARADAGMRRARDDAVRARERGVIRCDACARARGEDAPRWLPRD